LTKLYVRVCLHGAVADQRLCSVGDEVWLGSAPDALVAFPGPSIQVRRFGPRLQVQGRWLDPGRPMRLKRGELEVHLEAVEASRRQRSWSLPVPDLRVLVASAAVVLLGAWWEAVGHFMERHPEAVAALTGQPDAVLVHHVQDAPEALRARVHEHESGHEGARPLRHPYESGHEGAHPLRHPYESQDDAKDTATRDTAVVPEVPTSYPVGFLDGYPHQP